MQQEAYDLARVTATLDAMKARRKPFPATCGFDLAERSSSESDDDSEQSDSTCSLPSDDDGGHPGRGRAQKSRIKDSLDLSMSVLMPVPCEGPVQSSIPLVQDKLLKPEAVFKVSKIPRLVQQRRQLHAVPKSTDKVLTQTPSELRREVRRTSDSRAHPQPSACRRPSSRKSSSDAVGGSMAAAPSAVNNVAKEVEPPSSDPSPSAGSLGISTPFAHTKVSTRQSIISKKAGGSNMGNAPDEFDSPSAEEQELLQSLARLDRRLSNVSAIRPAVVRQGGQVRTESELSTDHCLDSSTTEGYRSVDVIDSDDKEMVRAAAYGGGTHCKSHTPTSISVRSSSAKRAELSSGVHKARVRVGGALTHDARRSSDGSGKHKVVVKKDLAHLLF